MGGKKTKAAKQSGQQMEALPSEPTPQPVEQETVVCDPHWFGLKLVAEDGEVIKKGTAQVTFSNKLKVTAQLVDGAFETKKILPEGKNTIHKMTAGPEDEAYEFVSIESGEAET